MLKLFNSYSRQREEFKPLKGKTVSMYNCGPTVYDYAHIGNLRTFLFADVLRRYLEYGGYKVKQVMNITDVGHALGDADAGGDKIEEGARREGLSPVELARKYEALFMKDIAALNLEPAWKYPRASEHVGEMVAMISNLLKKGIAYEVEGDVYFDISQFPDYGKLSGNTIEALNAGARVEINPKKKNPFDFALWINNPKHLMQWTAPWGKGYPGWHIECSAMSSKYLGETIDIHTGAEDNKFPHHECEIAQSEAANGKKFVRFWLHAAHLLVDGKKMSKSLNNFYKLDDLVGKGYEPRVIRYALISSHYREQQNFTLASLDAAAAAIKKLDALWMRLSIRTKNQRPNSKDRKYSVHRIVETARIDFAEAMDDDLNVPKALGALFAFARETNAALDEGGGMIERAAAKKFMRSVVENALGVELRAVEPVKIPVDVQKLMDERDAARKAKDYKKADEIRQLLKDKGFEVKDNLSVGENTVVRITKR